MSLQHYLETPTNHEAHFACFSTKEYHLIGKNFSQTLMTPAADTAHFNQRIADRFKEMKNNGDKNPILIAAIPFDIRNDAVLNFYSDYDKSDQKTKKTDLIKNETHIKNKTLLVNQDKFKKTVNYALETFKNTELTKIVLSQAVDVSFDKSQNLAFYLDALLDKNPTAYNFVIPVDNQQYLLGASPELLLSKNDRLVKSNPLAGSRPKRDSLEHNQKNQQALQESIKDQHEHKIVVENISRNLVADCVTLSMSEFPEVLETSTMFHLSSTLQGTLRKAAPNALSLALKLHPTPAVCGTPTQLPKILYYSMKGMSAAITQAWWAGWMQKAMASGSSQFVAGY